MTIVIVVLFKIVFVGSLEEESKADHSLKIILTLSSLHSNYVFIIISSYMPITVLNTSL